uniref:Uncharacterized protein n=1 Tax=Oryza barthii TaxID=65489 RepID=A0A0D3H663_9ORYZ
MGWLTASGGGALEADPMEVRWRRPWKRQIRCVVGGSHRRPSSPPLSPVTANGERRARRVGCGERREGSVGRRRVA